MPITKIIIDASFVRTGLTYAAKTLIESGQKRSVGVYCFNHLKKEVEALCVCLPSDKVDMAKADLEYILSKSYIKDASEQLPEGCACDVFDFASVLNNQWIEGRINKAIVITADESLIERMALSGLQIDVFDLYKNEDYSLENYKYYIDEECLNLSTDTATFDFKYNPEEGGFLYTATARKIQLGDKLERGSGSEAVIYKVFGNGDRLAKIFYASTRTKGKIKNVENLIKLSSEFKNMPWAVFPLEMLYADEGLTKPVGFLQRHIKNTMSLEGNPLFLGDFNDSTLETVCPLNVYPYCYLLVSQIRLLNMYGIYLTDYNLKNFAHVTTDPRYICMWDADSFNHKDYFYDVVAGRCHLIYDYDKTNKLHTMAYSNELLYNCIFEMLSLGDSLFKNDDFKYDDTSYANYWRKEGIKSDIWELYESSFLWKTKRPFSVELLLVAIKDAYADKEFLAKPYGEFKKEGKDKANSSKNTPSKKAHAPVDNSHFFYKSAFETADKGDDHGVKPENGNRRSINQPIINEYAYRRSPAQKIVRPEEVTLRATANTANDSAVEEAVTQNVNPKKPKWKKRLIILAVIAAALSFHFFGYPNLALTQPQAAAVIAPLHGVVSYFLRAIGFVVEGILIVIGGIFGLTG